MSKLTLVTLSQSLVDMRRAVKNLSRLRSMFPVVVVEGGAPPYRFSSHTMCKPVSFSWFILCHIFHILVLLLVISLFKTEHPKFSA